MPEEASPHLPIKKWPETCHICSAIQSTTPEWGITQRTGRHIADSAAKGCESCSLLLQGITYLIPDSESIWSVSFAPYNVSGSQDSRGNDLEGLFRLLIGTSSTGWSHTWSLEFFSDLRNFRNLAVPFPQTGSAVNILPAPDGALPDNAFSTVSEWIKECDESHDDCKRHEDSTLPTRLLDIGCSNTDTIKLFEPLQHEKGDYACLSHCWGSVPFFKTYKATLEANKKGIAWNSLTKTFQDAILMARRLRIRWLWIDALCIIQDDKDDWAREAANMASVYENAYITISATKSRDGNGGLFSRAIETNLILRSKNGNEYIIRVFTDPVDGAVDEFGASSFFDSWHWKWNRFSPPLYPLLGRGWCYQERILSSRVLHFGHQEVLWECRTGLTCECEKLQDMPSLKPALGKLGRRRSNPSVPSPKGKSNALIKIQKRTNINDRTWRTIVQGYSNGALTRPSDRLPAISGLAKRVNMDTADYLAGIWRPSLLHDLVWRVAHGPVPRPTCWIAPSWSWAATDSAVKFVGPRSGSGKSSRVRWHSSILEVSCNPKGSDPTGQVKSGFLRAKGRLVPAYISGLRSYWSPYYLHRFHPSDDRYCERFPGLSQDLFLDHPLEDRVEEFTAAPPFAIYCLAMVSFFTRDRGDDFMEDDSTEDDSTEHDFTEHDFTEQDLERCTYFLILRCIDIASQKYQRIGIGREIKGVEEIDPQTRRGPLVSKLFSKEATKDTVIEIK
ncbi:heterokaryon incompatibility protein-domain-containing protein [Aspergillus transmontanensis]|uniref:Heterokaryon incompatibility protein-domain-containing protein n=1 Tax=Aspergillus transmontanensis TaxID=1034304 RepID=A0A5N6W0Z2_9EURO|nr:heterokaryon incompatibility protein-domain-containing protein [Aspergillus transmontanensis]